MWREAIYREYRQVAAEVMARLRHYPQVRGLALFGSVSEGAVWERSDIDVLMLVERSEADWQAFELYRGPWRIHLQVIRGDALLEKSDLIRAAALGELLLNARVTFDPQGLLHRLIDEKREECRHFQFTEIVSACVKFLTEFRNAQKQLSIGDVDSAFLCCNLAFAALTDVEMARLGFAPTNRPPGFEKLSPKLVEAYRALISDSSGLKKRIRLAFMFFDQQVNELVANISPSVVHAVKRSGAPLPLEDFGELPEIANTSSEIQYLVDVLVQHGVILLTRKQAHLEGYPLEGLESLLVELS